MLSKEQQEIKEKNVLKTVQLFIKTGKSNIELATELGLTSSAVQRYLHDKEIIVNALGNDAYNLVQDMIKENKKEALSKGGKISQMNNESIRDENGHFIGNRKK